MKNFYVLSFDGEGEEKEFSLQKLKAKNINQVYECIQDSIATNTSVDIALTTADFKELKKVLRQKVEADDISEIYEVEEND